MEVHKIQAAVLSNTGGPLQNPMAGDGRPSGRRGARRIVSAGICHTDIALCDDWNEGFSAVLGHEGAGLVEQPGKDVTSVRPGDHVVLSYQSCGRCRPSQQWTAPRTASISTG